MKIRSLGLKSELIFTDFDGEFIDRGHYAVVRTTTNPTFFWGNLLVFDRPPQAADFSDWMNLSQKEFTDPRMYHRTFAWESMNGEIGDVSRFLESGFELEAKAVLSARTVVPPPKLHSEVEVRPISTDHEWHEMVRLQVNSAHLGATPAEGLSRDQWFDFYSNQSLRYRAMERSSCGTWFGGFLRGRLVAGLGIFHRGPQCEDRLGRFQIVCTDPEFRRQGLCGTLVYRASLEAFEKMGLQQLVMCADPDYFALKIYESVGFTTDVVEHGLCWWDRSRH